MMETNPVYASSLDDISEATKDKIRHFTEDAIAKDEEVWNEKAVLKSMAFTGYYFLAPKENVVTDTHNELYCTYKVTATLTGLDRDRPSSFEGPHDVIYFTYCRFIDLPVSPEGASVPEEPAGTLCEVFFDSDYGIYSQGTMLMHALRGYVDSWEMYDDCVGENKRSYRYESTVKESASRERMKPWWTTTPDTFVEAEKIQKKKS